MTNQKIRCQSSCADNIPPSEGRTLKLCSQEADQQHGGGSIAHGAPPALGFLFLVFFDLCFSPSRRVGMLLKSHKESKGLDIPLVTVLRAKSDVSALGNSATCVDVRCGLLWAL